MSTQEIRRLIDAVADSHGEGRVRLALTEVEAIEAALALEGIRPAWHGDAWFASGDELTNLDAAADVLERIAKESSGLK